MRALVAILVALIWVHIIEAQVKVNGIYWTLLYGKDMLAPQAMLTVEPHLDNHLLLMQTLMEEALGGLNDPGPPKFAQAVDMRVNSSTDGIWTILPSRKLRVWRAQITSPGAISLSFIFDNFRLAPGSEFYVKTDQVLFLKLSYNLVRYVLEYRHW